MKIVCVIDYHDDEQTMPAAYVPFQPTPMEPNRSRRSGRYGLELERFTSWSGA